MKVQTESISEVHQTHLVTKWKGYAIHPTAKKKCSNQEPLSRDCTYYLPEWEKEPN
jgi:hypothetical protein